MNQKSGPPGIYELTHIKHSYGNDFILSIENLTIAEEISLGIAGHNGSGKSTLMRLLAFLEVPQSGEIRFAGQSRNNGDRNALMEITMMLQTPYLLKRSVFDNISYGLEVRKDTAELKDRVYESMRWVALEPEKFARRWWNELSGGEAQRVALASRLILRPRVLILDEPVANVDRESAVIISDAVMHIREHYKTTLIITSHDNYWLSNITDKIIKMRDGRIIGTGEDNVLQGPWNSDVDDLWTHRLPGGEKIYATRPPDSNSYALLSPTDIILSGRRPFDVSARNVLMGRIIAMNLMPDSDTISVEINAAGLELRSVITHHAASDMGLVPGRDIWLMFKASSLRWRSD